MWGTDMGTGCGVRISGANRREGFGWKIRASDVGVDGEGGTWNLGLDRGMRGDWEDSAGEAGERWWDVGEMLVECWWNVVYREMEGSGIWWGGKPEQSAGNRGLEGVGGVRTRA